MAWLQCCSLRLQNCNHAIYLCSWLLVSLPCSNRYIQTKVIMYCLLLILKSSTLQYSTCTDRLLGLTGCQLRFFILVLHSMNGLPSNAWMAFICIHRLTLWHKMILLTQITHVTWVMLTELQPMDIIWRMPENLTNVMSHDMAHVLHRSMCADWAFARKLAALFFTPWTHMPYPVDHFCQNINFRQVLWHCIFVVVVPRASDLFYRCCTVLSASHICSGTSSSAAFTKPSIQICTISA